MIRVLIAIALLLQQGMMPGPGTPHSAGGGGVTWTLINKASNFTCVTNACAVNYTSTAGNLIAFVGTAFNTGGQPTFSSCTGDTPTHATGAYAAVNVSTIWQASDICYVLSSSGGLKTYDFTFSGGSNSDIEVIEYHRSSGTAVFDTANAASSSACPSSICTGPTLTLTGSSDVIVQAISVSQTCSAVSGAFTNPFDSDSANVFSYFAGALSQSSGTGPTWTCSTTPAAAMSGAAFK